MLEISDAERIAGCAEREFGSRARWVNLIRAEQLEPAVDTGQLDDYMATNALAGNEVGDDAAFDSELDAPVDVQGSLIDLGRNGA